MKSSLTAFGPDAVRTADNDQPFLSKGRSRHKWRVNGATVGFVDFHDDEIAWLMVMPEWQSRGIGSALLRSALSEMGAVARVLCVLSNTAALRFYVRHGFVAEPGLVTGRMFGVTYENHLLLHTTATQAEVMR